MLSEGSVEEKETFLRELFAREPDATHAEAARALRARFRRGVSKTKVYALRNEVRNHPPPITQHQHQRPWVVEATPEQASFLKKFVEELAERGVVPMKVDHTGDGYAVITFAQPH